MRNTNSFWDRIAEGYAKKPVANQAAYEEKLRITRSHFRPDMELLEFGCGTGTTALLHAPHVKHIRATDISAKMIEIARGKAEVQGITNVTFEQTGIEDLTVADGSVDMVLAMSILHLLEDMDAMLAKVHRMLKPGGLLVSSTVCIGDSLLLNAFIRIVGPVGRLLGRMPMVRVISEQHLVDRLTAAGFVIEQQWRPEKSLGVFIVARKTV